MTTENILENNPITWLNQYGDALYSFARSRVRDSFTAEDLVQETLLAAYRSRKSYSGKSTVKTWLTGILKNKIVDHYRKSTPVRRNENLDSVSNDSLFDEREKWKVKPIDWSKDPARLYESKELLAVIYRCLDEMPENLSRTYTMREMQDFSTNEICNMFGMKKNNCWVILYRARMLLRRCLESAWFT